MLRRTHLVIAVALFSLAAPVLWAQQRAGGPPPAAAPPKGTGVVIGQVVDGTTDRPVADAVVNIGFGRGSPPLPGRAGTPPAFLPVITGADGRFVFRDLPAGRTPLTASASGYIESTAGGASPLGQVRPLELADGQRITDLKIRLFKYAVVTGTIVDEAGEPAVGVQVRAVRRPFPGQGLQFGEFVEVSTDDRGAYRISTLKPGDYYIAVPQTYSTVPAK